MADISKEELKKEIAAILKDADIATITAKKIRTQLEENLDIKLGNRKKEVEDLAVQLIDEKKKPKKNGKGEDDESAGEEKEDEDEPEDKDEEEEEEASEDEEEEEVKKPKRGAPKKAPKRKKASSDESEEEGSDAEKESDEEYSPKKKQKGAKGKKGGKGKKKKGSESDSDEEWTKKKASPKKGGPAKKGQGRGFNKACQLSPELAAIVGSDSMPRSEVVKKVWSYVKENNLYDPDNKQFAICNEDLKKVIGIKRFRTFGMLKYLKKHFVD